MNRKTEEKKDPNGCEIFHCSKRGDRYCCRFCPKRDRCHNPCLNSPDRCGKYFRREEENTK